MHSCLSLDFWAGSKKKHPYIATDALV